MNDGGLIGIIGAVAVALVAALGAVYTARSGGRSSPYAALETRVLNLEKQHDADAKLHEEDRTLVASLERRIAAVIADRDDVVGYLVVFREWVSMGASPPAPRVPMHLRDVIPLWVPDDSDRSTDLATRHESPGSAESVGP
jgi:hypothetical protein